MPVDPHQRVCLSRCPRCDYALSALPRRHRCPECGFPYDESMFVLEGWSLPDLRSSLRELLRYAGGLFVALVLLRLAFGWSWRVLGGIAFAVLVVFAVLHVYVWARHGGHSRALVRYLITADGVGRPGGRIYLWSNYSHLMLLPDGKDAWRLHLYPSWWRIFGPPIVNARLEGLQSEAEAVRAEIQRRISRARAAEAEARSGAGSGPPGL